MPEIPINYLAVIVAAIANMVIGFAWYGPLFGKQWIKLSGHDMVKMKSKMKGGGMTKTYILAVVSSLIMAFVLKHSLVFASNFLGVTGVSAGIQGAFWNWLGFIAPVTLSGVLWEGKPWALWVLNSGYYLVSLMVMGVILAVWG